MWMSVIRVAVAGAGGRMGREVVKMVLEDETLQLAAAIDPSEAGVDAGTLAGKGPVGVTVTDDLAAALASSRPDVLVDFTNPKAAMPNAETSIAHGVRPVIGTTGFTPEQIVAKLRQIEVHLSQGRSIALACRDAEISEQSYYRWRKEYGGLQLEQAKRLKELERENNRLRRLVADLSLEKQVLKDVASGNL